MPSIRVVMPNGTTRLFREGTPRRVIRAAQRDMLASMHESDEDHRAYRAKRKFVVTANGNGGLSRLPKIQDDRPPSPLIMSPELPVDPPAEQPHRYPDVQYLSPVQRREITNDWGGFTNKAGETARAGAMAAGMVGQEELALPLEGIGAVMDMPWTTRMLSEQTINAINRHRERQMHPGKPDWLLRRLLGDKLVDEFHQRWLQTQIPHVQGNNALNATGGIHAPPY